MQRRNVVLAAAVIGCLTLASEGWSADTFQAKITGVRDGDSLVVGHLGVTVYVDLAGIQAPRASSEHGKQARALLVELAKKKKAEIEVLRTHLGEIRVARVAVDGQDLATALIKAGLARPTTEATKEQLAAADSAKAAQAGIWATASNPASTDAG
jgi:endonuclease YncB( thermonuclease family)